MPMQHENPAQLHVSFSQGQLAKMTIACEEFCNCQPSDSVNIALHFPFLKNLSTKIKAEFER